MSILKDGAYYRVYNNDKDQKSGLCKHSVELLCNFCSKKKEEDGYILDYLEPVNKKDKCEKCGCSVLSHRNFVDDLDSVQQTFYGHCCINCD